MEIEYNGLQLCILSQLFPGDRDRLEKHHGGSIWAKARDHVWFFGEQVLTFTSTPSPLRFPITCLHGALNFLVVFLYMLALLVFYS